MKPACSKTAKSTQQRCAPRSSCRQPRKKRTRSRPASRRHRSPTTGRRRRASRAAASRRRSRERARRSVPTAPTVPWSPRATYASLRMSPCRNRNHPPCHPTRPQRRRPWQTRSSRVLPLRLSLRCRRRSATATRKQISAGSISGRCCPHWISTASHTERSSVNSRRSKPRSARPEKRQLVTNYSRKRRASPRKLGWRRCGARQRLRSVLQKQPPSQHLSRPVYHDLCM
mmetsp:Transcript_46231/g.142575  ORF Transcript_46231/g.142575 Transcript_46231/m.142575 type:complete len:229 (-) Transcript_46231:11-697(-)